jgi:hypothetical protein
MRKLLEHLGLMPTARDLALRELVNHSYASVRVVGRGTIKIDPTEVRRSPEFQAALAKAAEIVHKQPAG